MNKPELLAPAGDLEKLKIAVEYGADAVYAGGHMLGLRAKAKNFDITELTEGINYAHVRGKKVYITVNIFAHEDDFEGLADYLSALEAAGADALIISDPGIFSVARKTVPDVDIHISTQANNTNSYSAMFWREQGAKRIVAARELSLDEIKRIRKNLPEDFVIETFVHGAMCISYSGRCLLSNYLSGRDANRGECAHPCRWNYTLMENTREGEYFPVFEDERGTYIFNSKDLCMIQNIPDLVSAGIGSFKIEGRMKTPYYVATAVKAYREAIDDYFSDAEKYERRKNDYLRELEKASHRNYTTGFYYGKPGRDEQVYNSSSYIRTYDFIAVVLDYNPKTKMALLEQRNKFSKGDIIEVLRKKGDSFTQETSEMYDEFLAPIKEAPHAQQKLYLKMNEGVSAFDMLRRPQGLGL